MVCKHCGTSFVPRHPTRAVFCSGRCRVKAWKAEQEREAVRRFVARLAREVGLKVEDAGSGGRLKIPLDK